MFVLGCIKNFSFSIQLKVIYLISTNKFTLIILIHIDILFLTK